MAETESPLTLEWEVITEDWGNRDSFMKKVELKVGFERRVGIIKCRGSKKTNKQRSG